MTKQAYREKQRVSPLGEAGIEALRKIVSEHQAAKINEVLVDGFSASAIIQVYDQLNDKNKEKLKSLPVAVVADVVFKTINK